MDLGHVVMCDKALLTMFVDNGTHYCSPTVQAKITKTLKQLGLPQLLPDAETKEVWWRKIDTGGLQTTSGVPMNGKRFLLGGETREIISAQVFFTYIIGLFYLYNRSFLPIY